MGASPGLAYALSMARLSLVLPLAVLLGSCGTPQAPDAGACETSGPWSLPYPSDPCTSANVGEARCEGGCGWECGSDGCWRAFCDGPCWGDAGL